MRRILVDVMGADNSPAELIEGAYRALCEQDVSITLVGRMSDIQAGAAERGIPLDKFEIADASEVVTMNDDPTSPVRTKTDSSMTVGLRMLADGKGDAFVSAGNTGALFTAASLIVRRISGIRRPAIGTILPVKPPVLLIDSGANVTVTPEYFEQFAIMGHV